MCSDDIDAIWEEPLASATRRGLVEASRRVEVPEISWGQLRERGVRQRRRRRLVPVAAAAVIVVGAAALTSVWRGGDGGSSPRIERKPLMVTAAGSRPSPAVRSVTSAPTCRNGSALTGWTRSALSAFMSLPQSEATPVRVSTLTQRLPVLGVPPPGCVTAVTLGSAAAVEFQNQSGRVTFRAASVPFAGDLVPQRFTSQPVYFQNTIASGQTVNGAAINGRLEAVMRRSADNPQIVVVDRSATPLVTYADGVTLFARLYFADFAPLDDTNQALLPTRVPAGYSRCSAVVDRQVQYCDAEYNLISIGVRSQAPDAAAPPIAINGRRARVETESDAEVQIAVDLPPVGVLFARADAPVSLGQLRATAESIPALSPQPTGRGVCPLRILQGLPETPETGTVPNGEPPPPTLPTKNGHGALSMRDLVAPLLPAESSLDRAQDTGDGTSLLGYTLASGNGLTIARQKLSRPLSLFAITGGAAGGTCTKLPSGSEQVLVRHSASQAIQVILARPNGTLVNVIFNAQPNSRTPPEFTAESLARAVQQTFDNKRTDL